MAIAYTLQQLGRKGKIFVPENASELKLRRLINMGAEVIPFGKDLYDCGENAKKIAEEINGAYISPFATPDVIVGQGSMAVETLQQKEHFDDILIPLGGGGLLIGASVYFKYKLPNCRVHAIHPKIFNRSFSDNYFDALSKPTYPTIADGLAVQHSENDFISDLVKKYSDSIDQVSEKDIERGIVSMLNNEGLLVEGAGGTGIAALLNDPNAEKYKGDVLVVVSGGNISISSLMKTMATNTDDIEVGKLLGFNSTLLPHEAIKYGANDVTNQEGDLKSDHDDISANDIWNSLTVGIQNKLEIFKRELSELIEYSKYENLYLSDDVINNVLQDAKELEKMLKEILDEDDSEKKRELYRIAVQKYSYLRNSLSWCSASSAQSKKVMFFDPAENNDSACNYDRYGLLLLKQKETLLQKSLGFDTETTGLLLTSSGQAAYTVAESFLIRNVLSKESTVVSCPYIYFENLEQLESLKNVNLIFSKSWEIEEMIELVETNGAEALFVDPLANLGTLHTVDFRKFARLLDGHDWSNKWLVVDGTMVSGGINLFEIFNKPNHPNVMYIESGSKYIQFGLDLQMVGIVVASKKYLPILNNHRRNTGTAMYQFGVTKLPDYDRKVFLGRMRLLTRNAEILCRGLEKLNKDTKKINITFPHHWKDMGWKHGGGIVAVTFEKAGINNKPCLDFLIDLILEECRKENIEITKGVSFGFSTIRISAAAAMAQNMPPFLRFSIGEETVDEMLKICSVLQRCFNAFFEKYDIEGINE